MGWAGRNVRGIMVLVSVLVVAACGKSFNDAYCEANNQGNQQTLWPDGAPVLKQRAA